MAQPSAAVEPVPRKVLVPRKSATPLLHETLAWHGFQVEQHPASCQDVPAWLKRMCERELAVPICPGLLEPGWLQAQGLIHAGKGFAGVLRPVFGGAEQRL